MSALPGPGDVYTSPGYCLAPGSCPHDHPEPPSCESCGSDVDVEDDLCPGCREVPGADEWEDDL